MYLRGVQLCLLCTLSSDSSKISPLPFLQKTKQNPPHPFLTCHVLQYPDFMVVLICLIWFNSLHLSSTTTDSDTWKQVYFWPFSHFFLMGTLPVIQNVYSAKFITSAEHNFLVYGQVSLFTMPADLEQTNPFCDFIVGISISKEHSHAPLVHLHPTRNSSLPYHHNKRARAQCVLPSLKLSSVEMWVKGDWGRESPQRE